MSDFKDWDEVREILKPTLVLIRASSSDKRGDLTLKGVEQSEAMARTIKTFPIRSLYTSDLPRAVQTSNIIRISGEIKAPIKKTGLLKPWNLGKYPNMAGWETSVLMTKQQDAAPPGGESFRAFRKRWVLTLQALLEEASTNPREGFLVAVTHGENLQVALSWCRAGGDRDFLDESVLTSKVRVPQGEALVLTRNEMRWDVRPLKGQKESK